MTRLPFVLLPALALALLAGCATPPPPQPVADPYAQSGAVAVYQGNLAQGSLGREGTAEYFRDEVGDTVTFEQDQTSLTAEGRTTLARQAEWLKKHGDFTARVEGHADEKGTREYNLALGARRASAVQEYLVAQGIPQGRIRTNTFGKERPIEVCSTEICFARNRRAVTGVTPGGAGV